MPFSTAHPSLQAALSRKSYIDPTPVQAAILADEARDKDLLVSAQTGSGKTVAFGLALAPQLLGGEAKFGPAGAPLALIVTPTRELALQVHRELVWLYADTKARIATCVGGMDPRHERADLHHGVHIVVGTPGRLCDHLSRGALSLVRLQAVVLDEADEMLDMGFREDLERILDAAPPERRTLLFSATIPKDIATLAKRYQKQAFRIATSTEGERHGDIEYRAIPIVPRERDFAVVNLLRYHDVGALVFCATRDGVTRLAANLNERGFSVAALSGELSQRERNTALQALRDGRARVCVATDVAARGLDLPDLGLVIHADLPNNKQVLVHRSGRTGRAGKSGVAIVLVPDNYRRHAERMLHAANIEATWSRAPSLDEIAARDRTVLIEQIGTLAQDISDDDREIARILLETTSAEDLAAALVRQRRERLPSAEELSVPPSMRPQRESRPDARDNRRPDQRERELAPRGDVRRFEPREARRPNPALRHDVRAEHAPREERPTPIAPSERPASVERPKHVAATERPKHVAATERPKHVAATERPKHAAPAEPEAAGERAKVASPVAATHERYTPERVERATRHAEHPAHTPHAATRDRSSREHPPTDDADPRRAPAPKMSDDGAVWFTINVGRSKNADPKWLVPLLCRRGAITKREIGKIQILARETRVEIAGNASERFAEAIRQPDPKDRNIHIEPLDVTP